MDHESTINKHYELEQIPYNYLKLYSQLKPITNKNGTTYLGPYATNDKCKIPTANILFKKDLEDAQKSLAEYFSNPDKHQSPLNCLLLGPPGSGKSYLARKLSEMLEKELQFSTPVQVIGFNLATLGSPESVSDVFKEISIVKNKSNSPLIVLMDEFDVTITGSSLVRYLIQPMNEGIFSNIYPVWNTCFIFSGSYLKSKHLLTKLRKDTSKFDITKFLYDYQRTTRSKLRKKNTQQDFQMTVEYLKTRESISPDQDVFEYLRRLDKLQDFLSRIDGFVVELPDLSAPLECTSESLRLLPHGCDRDFPSCDSSRFKGPIETILKFATEREHREAKTTSERLEIMQSSTNDHQFLRYKNMLLSERFLRVYFIIKNIAIKSRAISNYEHFVNKIGHGYTKINCHILNFFCTIPVSHGMRSLEFIIRSSLKFDNLGKACATITQQDTPEGPDEHIFTPQFIDARNTDTISLHIPKSEVYESILSQWARIQEYANISTTQNLAHQEHLLLEIWSPNVKDGTSRPTC